MIFDGLRDHYEPIAFALDAIGLLLCGVCAVSLVFLMWCVL